MIIFHNIGGTTIVALYLTSRFSTRDWSAVAAGRQAGRREKGGETDSRPAAARARSRGGIYAPGNKGHIVPDGVRVCLSAACESEGTRNIGRGREGGGDGRDSLLFGVGLD